MTESSGESGTGNLLDGKAVARQLRREVKRDVEQLVTAGHRRPKLVAVLVGDDPASHAYVGSKARACAKVGIEGVTLRLPADVDQGSLVAHVDRLNGDETVDGILIQLPLPRHLPERALLNRVRPDKDVDGFHPTNVGRLWLDEPGLTPATPTGVVELLERYEIPLQGRHAVVVGRSAIVGKPMAGLLLRKSCTVSVCHSRTRDLAAMCRQADIVIAAVGVTALIGPDHVREGAVVVDVGMNRVDDAAQVEHLFPGDEARRARFEAKGSILTGDVDFTRVAAKASWITPVPGGVGPLTVAELLRNTLAASRARQGLAGEARA